MFAITDEELSNSPLLEETSTCPDCGEQHIVEYADEVLEDGTKVKSNLLACITCPKTNKSYLVGINGKKLL